jgi:hypothetical protein
MLCAVLALAASCGDDGNGGDADSAGDSNGDGERDNRCAEDQLCFGGECWGYEPAVGCATCGGCECPDRGTCCELEGYGVSCVDTDIGCP